MDRKTDRELQNEIQAELRWDTRVDATHIGVTVEASIVTLTGRVHSYTEKVAAVAAAHRVEGVLDVANEIHVKGIEELTDSDLAEAVRHTLTWDNEVLHDRIHTTVCEAIVTLTGTVDRSAQRDDAVRAVRTVRGVRAVIDNLRVRASAMVA
jgi:osmotically-inducible protein OsmY